MYVVTERWKVKDVNGRLRKGGECVELSKEDAARLLKTGVIREVSYNANDYDRQKAEPGVNEDDGKIKDDAGDDEGDGDDDSGDDGGSFDKEINNADDIPAAGGDFPGVEDLGGNGAAPEKPKGRRKK